MKNLFLIMFLFLNISQALGSWIKKSELKNCENYTVFTKKKNCGSNCVKIDKYYNCNYSILIDEEIDDLTSPVFSKNILSECGENCESTFENEYTEHICLDDEEKVVLNLDLKQIYCTKFLRYNKKKTGRKIVGIDQTKKDEHEQKLNAKKLSEQETQSQLQDMDFGKRLNAWIIKQNKKRGLSREQRKQIRSSQKDLRADLLDGNICDFYNDLAEVVVDGTLITQEIVNKIKNKVESYRECN